MSAFISAGSLCVPLSMAWKVLAVRGTLSLKFLISWEQLAELIYHMIGKISQVLGHSAILEPISMTWCNGAVRLPRPGSQASGGGTTESGPSLQHRTCSR